MQSSKTGTKYENPNSISGSAFKMHPSTPTLTSSLTGSTHYYGTSSETHWFYSNSLGYLETYRWNKVYGPHKQIRCIQGSLRPGETGSAIIETASAEGGIIQVKQDVNNENLEFYTFTP